MQAHTVSMFFFWGGGVTVRPAGEELNPMENKIFIPLVGCVRQTRFLAVAQRRGLVLMLQWLTKRRSWSLVLNPDG